MTDIAYDGFEDYFYARGETVEPWERHFAAVAESEDYDLEEWITDVAAHTGNYSVGMSSDANVLGNLTINYPTLACDPEDDCGGKNPCACVHTFAPAAAQKYQLSLWLANTESLDCGSVVATPGADRLIPTTSRSFNLRVGYLVNGSWQYLNPIYPRGPIIEGWQRITATLDIPAEASSE